MSDVRTQTFRLEEPDLGESALQAQILLRCRRSIDHDLKNAVQALHSGIEVMSRTLQSSGNRKLSPQECIPLLQQQLANLQSRLAALLEEVAPAEETAAPAVFDVVQLILDLQRFLNHERGMAQAELQLPAQANVMARRSVIRRVLLGAILDALDAVESGGSLQFSVIPDAEEVVLTLRVSAANTAALALSPTRKRLREILERTLANEGLSVGFIDAAGVAELRLQLPLQQATIATVTAAQPMESESDEAGSGMRILVVDDNHDAADSLTLLLELEGHSAKPAYTGEQALALVMDYRPALVLLDIGLPDMAGDVVAQRIREAGGPQPLLVSISGFDRGTRRNAAAPFSFDAELVKPVELSALRKLLATLPR